MSKDNTCSGFDPEAIAQAAFSAGEAPDLVLQGPLDGPLEPLVRVLPRPVVDRQDAQVVLAELDDLIRWCAELASNRRQLTCSAINVRTQEAILNAAEHLGAARALVIAGEQQ